MKKDEFESLLHEEIEIIKSKLKSKPHGDKVIKGIQNAYKMFITDRFRFFFKEIELAVETHEWNAIEERHKFAHGRIEFDTTEWKTVMQHTQTYETLLHKILLKLLKYSGSYIDRSIVGWKDKQLI